jgi:predicted O-methyltransferase YrrM
MSTHPARGDRSAYARYLAGMDASMKQKVALTAAHLLCEGRVADMGTGSGGGAQALAALYPELRVIGVDLDPTTVAIARDAHRLPNLDFVVGDVAQPVFEPGSLDGIFDSSVLHHVTSFGGYDHEAAARALAAQVPQLRAHGVLVVRDFVHPGEGLALLDVRHDDGAAPGEEGADDPRRCSTAALLERFSREFRSLHAAPGFALERLASAAFAHAPHDAPAPGFTRYRLALHHAVEFVLRKDYREDWGAEAKEEYGYFTQSRFEELFAALGLRVLASQPIRNPWIVRHRFRGKIALRDEHGALRETPATNYVIVGERVAEDEGVRLRDAGEAPAPGFLEMRHYRDRRTGYVRDLVRRPHVTVDVVPWFELDGDVFVLARTSYPRPIPATEVGECPSLDGASRSTWLAEPLHARITDWPIGETVEETLLSLLPRLSSSDIRGFTVGSTYYPSPGGIQEEVRSIFVEIAPLFVEERLGGGSPFRSAGRVRAIEAKQLLRAAQVGGLPDARLEVNVRDLLGRLGREAGPWIGEELERVEATQPPRAPTTVRALLGRAPRRAFERVPTRGDAPPFLAIHARSFEELDRAGHVRARAVLEVVVPTRTSGNSVAVAPLLVHGGVTWLGVDDDDLPAAQCFHGNSEILVAPAWRLPREIATRAAALTFTRERLRDEYGVEVERLHDLGGRYLPSPGMTPEAVYPLAAMVRAVHEDAPKALRWVRLDDAAAEASRLVDGHLRIAALRAAHACGLDVG